MHIHKLFIYIKEQMDNWTNGHTFTGCTFISQYMSMYRRTYIE